MSCIRVASGKPLYLGKGVCIMLGEGATLSAGFGVHLSSACVVQVGDGASMNEDCRVTVVESTRIVADTLFGPNVQIYDHDHEFDWGCVWSCVAHPRQSGGAAGCAPTPLSRAAARLRTARSCRLIPSSRGTSSRLAPCMRVRLHG